MSIPARGGHSTTIISHYAIVIGGSNHEVALKDTWALDIDTGHWQEFKTGGRGPSPRYAHSANVLATNLIIVFGGFDSHTLYNDMYILDLTTRVWSKVEPLGDVLPPPRYAHSASLVGRQLLVFGGCGAEAQALGDCWVFDLETLQWLQPQLQGIPPEPRSYHTASLIGDKILIFGGKKGKQWFSDVVMLDIPSRSWNPITLKGPGGAHQQQQQLSGRAYHTANVVNDNFICILGGFNGAQMCKDVLLIDLSSMRWLTYGKTDMLRCKHTTNLVRNSLLLFGGHDGNAFLNVFAKLDTDPLFEFLNASNPRESVGPAMPGISLQPQPEVPIDKENALVYNTEGLHVKPDLLVSQAQAVGEALSHLSGQLSMFEDEQLDELINTLDTALKKARNEQEVRRMQRERKRAKGGVRFGEVSVREHKRAVGHGAVTSDGGPALGMDSRYVDKLMRRLSSYENLKDAVRVPREEYMRSGYVAPQDRARLLLSSGASRPSMEQNMQEIARTKDARAESSMCPAAVVMSEAGLLPTASGNIKFRPDEARNF